ncbi:MAG: DUF748 domain-containing protein [Planctomycetota bacterium JB042]
MTETAPSNPGPSKRPRRWLRRIFLAGLLLGALVLAAPWIAGALAPPLVENELEKRLNVRADLGDLDLSYDGRVAVRAFALRDLDGRPLVSVAKVDVDADVRSAFDGLYRAKVEVDGFEVHVRKGTDGRINLQDVVRPGSGGGGDDRSSSGKDDAPPRVEAHVRVKNGRIVVHGDDGTTELIDVRLDADVVDLAKPVTFSAGLGVVGPGGPGGAISVSGSAVPLPPDGDETPRATAKLTVEALLLTALAPALSLALPIDPPTGRVDVDFDVELLKTLAVRGGGDVRVTDLVVPAAREGAAPLRLGAVTVTSKASVRPDLSGTQTVRVEAGDLLTLDYEGALARTDRDGMELAGKVTIDGSIDRLTAAARAFAPVKDDVAVAGRLDSTTDFHLLAGKSGLRRASLTTKTSLVGLSATGPDGPIDLGSLKEVVLGMTAKGDLEAKTARLDRLDARLGPVHVRGNAAASGVDAAALDPRAVRVEDSRFEVDADLDRLVRDLRPLVDLSEHAIAGDLKVVATAKQDGDAIVLTADVRPTGLVAKGITVDAAPLAVEATVTPTDAKVDARATLTTDRLAVTLPDGKRVEQKAIRARADLEHKTAADVVTVNDLGFRSETAQVDVKGRLLAATDPTDRTAELNVDLKTALEVLRRDLGAFLGELPYDGRGAVASRVELRAHGDRVALEGTTTLENLDLTVRSKDPAKPPLRIAEPKVAVDLDTDLVRSTGRVEIARLGVDSKLLRGKLSGAVDGAVPPAGATAAAPDAPATRVIELDGIEGEFFYVPDRLAVLLAPYLPAPAELRGSEEERVTLDLNGRLEDFDPLTLLESSKGGVHVGLGTLLVPGIETGGTVALELATGRASLTGDLGANGGTIDLLGDLGTSVASKAKSGEAMLSLDVKDLAINAKLGEMLSFASPLFSSADGLNQNQLGGLLSAKVQLAYGEPLTLQRIARDWQTLDPRLLEGGIHLSLDKAVVQGSPLLAKLLDKIDVPVGEELSIAPIDLTIGGGKLSYAEPWTWKFGDVKTNFTGSIDFDKSLDLGWNVPITKKLVKKYDFLKSLKGESISFPLTGTIANPNLQFDGIITQLAEKAAKQTLQNELEKKLGDKLGDKLPGELGEKIPGLGGILGGDPDKPKVDVPKTPGTELPKTDGATVEPTAPDDPDDPDEPTQEPMPTDPAEILKKADALWDAGEEKAARKYYKELKKRHQISIVFLLNKDRIEDRAKKK